MLDEQKLSLLTDCVKNLLDLQNRGNGGLVSFGAARVKDGYFTSSYEQMCFANLTNYGPTKIFYSVTRKTECTKSVLSWLLSPGISPYRNLLNKYWHPYRDASVEVNGVVYHPFTNDFVENHGFIIFGDAPINPTLNMLMNLRQTWEKPTFNDAWIRWSKFIDDPNAVFLLALSTTGDLAFTGDINSKYLSVGGFNHSGLEPKAQAFEVYYPKFVRGDVITDFGTILRNGWDGVYSPIRPFYETSQYYPCNNVWHADGFEKEKHAKPKATLFDRLVENKECPSIKMYGEPIVGTEGLLDDEFFEKVSVLVKPLLEEMLKDVN